MSGIERVQRGRQIFAELSRETLLGYALLLPATFIVFAIIVYPIVRAVTMGFFEVSFLTPTDMTWVGLEHYRTLLNDDVFMAAFKNTVILTVVTVSLQYILGLGLALLLNQPLPGMKWIRTLVLIAWICPLVVIVILFDFANHPNFGIINVLLGSVGLPTKYWLGDTTWAFPMVMVMHIWNATPFFAIVFLAALQGIPGELYEAAKMDGANSVMQFRYITFPHLSYVSMILIVLYVIAWFNSFTLVFVSTGGGPLRNTELLATYIYKQAFSIHALGYAASIGTVTLVILLVFTITYAMLETKQ